MTHGYHDALPGFSDEYVLQDGCAECEARSRAGLTGLAHLDDDRLGVLWNRLLLRERGVAYPSSRCDEELIEELYRVAVLLGRLGMGPRSVRDFKAVACA